MFKRSLSTRETTKAHRFDVEANALARPSRVHTHAGDGSLLPAWFQPSEAMALHLSPECRQLRRAAADFMHLTQLPFGHWNLGCYP